MADEVLESDIACLDQYDYFFRPDLLSGKVAFITGGGSGIGFTITEVLMRYNLDHLNLKLISSDAFELHRLHGGGGCPAAASYNKGDFKCLSWQREAT